MDEQVLIVEDDTDIIEILRLYLEGNGYTVLAAENGQDGLRLLRECDVSCVILDLMMPVMNGFDFVKSMREFCDVPVIVLSARTQPADKMLSLELGADSFIAKPFDSMEVIAYVKAAIRRYKTMGHQRADQTMVTVGEFELNLEELTIRKCGKTVPLTAFEFKIMAKLMSSPGRIFTKAQLYEAAMGVSYEGAQDTIMVHISNIRAKIDDEPDRPSAIVTVRGLGYRFDVRS